MNSECEECRGKDNLIELLQKERALLIQKLDEFNKRVAKLAVRMMQRRQCDDSMMG